MRIDESTEAIWILYLINVMQPVNRDELDSQSRKLLETAGRANKKFNLDRTLASLASAHMVLLREDGRYAATILGLHKLSLFNLGFARDKNRMFVLKNRFRK